MRNLNFSFRLTTCLLGAILLAGGCSFSSVKHQARKVTQVFRGDKYKKKIALVPFRNKTFIPAADVETALQTPFIEHLKALCPDMIYLTPADPGYPEALLPGSLPRMINGDPDNLALSKIGRQNGLNAIVLGQVIDVDAEEREKGILMFRNVHYYECIQVNFQIFDTGTSAKLLDESLKCDMEVDGAEFDAAEARDARNSTELNEALATIAEDGGDRVCDRLIKQTWEGYVTTVTEDGLVISTGRNAGIQPETVLDLYEKGETIQGKEGYSYIIPGPHVGEIRVTSVSDDHSQAVVIGDTVAQPGFTVRIQD